jgi:hypothetical protein
VPTIAQNLRIDPKGVGVGIAAVRAALLLAAVLAFVQAASAPGGAAKAHGRDLVAEYELPAEQVALYRAHAAAGTAPSRSTASWDPLQWIGPRQSAGSGRNPYTLVLSISGVAPAEGDVRSHWHAGWEVQETPAATRDVLLPLAVLSSGRVAAGTPLTLTAAGAPVTFRGERTVAPMLNLAQAHNFEIQSVRLALWSGSAPWAWPTSSAAILLGLVCAAGWWALRGVGAAAPSARPAPRSTLPPLPTPATIDIEAPPPHRAEPPPAAVAPVPRPNHAARVVDSLRDVLANAQAAPAARRARGPNRGLRTG